MSKGIKHDGGKPPLDLVSNEAMLRIAEVMDMGKRKYGAHNWRGGIEWSRVLAAGLRHLMAFTSGEDKDPESGLSHLAHAGCCIHFLLEYEKYHKDLDDRYKRPLSQEFKPIPAPAPKEEKREEKIKADTSGFTGVWARAADKGETDDHGT